MALHELSGAGAPTSTPTGINQHYLDTVTGNMYFSKGITSSADWVLMAASGSGGAVTSVFGRTGDVVAQPGDYTYTEVGAEPAGAVAAHVALADPHTQYLKESDNILIAPQIIKVKISNAGTGEFTSLSTAVASITDANPISKPYVIEIGPGIHTVANPLILPSGVSLRGETINGTTLIPQNANQHLLALNNMCEVSF